VTLQYKHAGFSGWAGAARADITPPVGIYARNWGAASHDAAEGIHRPLAVTALAICDNAAGGDPLVLVDADLGWWRSVETERAFRRRLLDALGLDEARFLFALTHTHAAPPLTDHIEPAWEGGDLLAPYLEHVWEATIDAARRAIASLAPGVIEWRRGKCGLATGRDLIDPDRPDRIVCGFDPGASADDTLLVGRVTNTATGKAIATVVNYACHPTTLAWDNRLISPDYLGAMREAIEQGMIGGLTLFGQGASGELSPRLQYLGDTAVADAHGRELGHAVLATLAGMEPPGTRLAYDGVRESGAPLAVWRREPAEYSKTLQAVRITVDLPLKDWPPAAELERDLLAETDRVTQERIRRKLSIRRGLGDGDCFSFPVWIWRIGDALLAANMAEAYSQIQRRLREEFPDDEVAYLNLVNGSIGYLPPSAAYSEDLYQVWQTPFDRGGLERLESAIAGAFRQIR
jgi:hypothetical protein